MAWGPIHALSLPITLPSIKGQQLVDASSGSMPRLSILGDKLVRRLPKTGSTALI